jgi:hypothetical protein
MVTKIGADITTITGANSIGFDFNPTVDRIRITTDNELNFRYHPDTGALVSTDTPLAYAAGDPGAGSNPSIVGSAYINNVAGAITTTLFNIDANRDVLVSQVPPNNGTLNTIGALGVDFQNFTGFDVSGTSGVAFASTTNAAITSSNLYSINLNTGAASLIGPIGNGLVFNDISVIAAVPEPSSLTLLAIVSIGGLFVLRRRSRKT